MTTTPPAHGAPFAAYQTEIYLAGAGGALHTLPLSWDALEAAAYEAMSAEASGYVAGGAGLGQTMSANRAAFGRWQIAPRMLRGAGERVLESSVCGTRMAAPVLLAPVGGQGILSPESEVGVARAAASVGLPIVLSTLSSVSMEEVAGAGANGPRWFQLYLPRARDIASSFVTRAERAGYAAIVVTVDTTMLGWRPRDLGNAFLPFLRGLGLGNYFSDPVFRGMLDQPPERDPVAAIALWGAVNNDPTLTWDDLVFLREVTALPILLKGICHPDDARQALDAGMDGIVVSNHGGRQIDGAVGALDALPGVVDAVAGERPVLFDSGIRSGADIVKALALGAQAVLIGRPYLWGLALGGEDGVRQVLRALLAELDLTLGLSGYQRPADLSPAALVRAPV